MNFKDKCKNCCCYKCANRCTCNVSFLDKESVPRCKYCVEKYGEKDVWYENCGYFVPDEDK